MKVFGCKRVLMAVLTVSLLFVPMRPPEASAYTAAIGAAIGILSDLFGAAKDAEELVRLIQLVDSVSATTRRIMDLADKAASAAQNAQAVLQCGQQVSYAVENTKKLFKDIMDYPAYASSNFGSDYNGSVQVARKGMSLAKDVARELAASKQLYEALSQGQADAVTVRSSLATVVSAVKRAKENWRDLVYEDLGFMTPVEAGAKREAQSGANVYSKNGIFSPSSPVGELLASATGEALSANSGKLVSMNDLKSSASTSSAAVAVVDESALSEIKQKIHDETVGPVINLASLIVGIVGSLLLAWQLLRFVNDSVEMGRDINPISNTFGKVAIGMIFFAIVMQVLHHLLDI